MHHYAFHVSEEEFDAIFGRIKESGLVHGSQPWTPEDMQVRNFHGGRTVYFHDLDRHLLEIRTRTSKRDIADSADRQSQSS